MSDPSGSHFKFGNVGRDVTIQQAGRDIIGGDKTTPEADSQREIDPQQFLEPLQELRDTLRELKAQVEQAPELSEDDKDSLVLELMQRLQDLKSTGALPSDAQALPEKRQPLLDSLQATQTLVEKTQRLVEKATEISLKLAPIAAHALQGVAKMRQWLGV